MKRYIFLLLLTFVFSGCKKFLDAKPDGRLLLPEDNLQNIQLLLNDTYIMNQQIPAAGEVGTDNIVFSDTQWINLKQSNPTSANLYIWDADLFNETDNNDWTFGYKMVFNANIALDALGTMPGGGAAKDDIEGQALFFRALAFYHLLQDFSKPFDNATADIDKGIVLRLTSDISTKSERATNMDSYMQVIRDLTKAIPKLKVRQEYKTTPSKAAAIGLLARVYLVMGDYPNALLHAEQYLDLSPTLLDYNNFSETSAFSFTGENPEVTFLAKLFSLSAYNTANGRVNDNFYQSYADNDLRRVLFFKDAGAGNITFKGSYYGTRLLFAGIATDEIYLIVAECYARTINPGKAMDILNALCINRYRRGSYTPYNTIDSKIALQNVLTERRKELILRNLRWSDLRRFGKDPGLYYYYQQNCKRS